MLSVFSGPVFHVLLMNDFCPKLVRDVYGACSYPVVLFSPNLFFFILSYSSLSSWLMPLIMSTVAASGVDAFSLMNALQLDVQVTLILICLFVVCSSCDVCVLFCEMFVVHTFLLKFLCLSEELIVFLSVSGAGVALVFFLGRSRLTLMSILSVEMPILFKKPATCDFLSV